MTISFKALSFATLGTLSLTTGFMLNAANASPLLRSKPLTQISQSRQSQTFDLRPIPAQNIFQPQFDLAAPVSLVGLWQGNMGSVGDDVLTNFDVTLSPGGNGSWKLYGGQSVMQQGTASASLQGSNVTIQLNGFSGQTVVLEGTLQNGGTKISGKLAGYPNSFFNLQK
ncbi:hypothetical protein [Picosynechococcus sp. PCC 8807]|uniref:hypothetical protein n=1 Tax=Picosynechococcus sp. PCC 8807 TaxID=195248 RepID=UPI000810E7B8|nr:hypothetical protein [Picosynechococcus sp. PCC 8807]ANV90727.1 hypothetical protein AWQ24_08835 [Picosynechococcus sp. PCC 8807]